MARLLPGHIYLIAEEEFAKQEELRKQAVIEAIAVKLTRAFQKELKNV